MMGRVTFSPDDLKNLRINLSDEIIKTLGHGKRREYSEKERV